MFIVSKSVAGDSVWWCSTHVVFEVMEQGDKYSNLIRFITMSIEMSKVVE